MMHFQDEHTAYKKVKEELVTGFNGELSDEMNIAYVTVYFCTNFFTFQVLLGFLVSHSSWFKWLRTDIYENRLKIFLCSLFDIIGSVIPIVFAYAEYDHAIFFHISAFSLIFLLMLIHTLTGK